MNELIIDDERRSACYFDEIWLKSIEERLKKLRIAVMKTK